MVFNVSYFYGQERFGDGLLFFRKHLVSIALGTVVAFVASRLPAETYRRAAYPLLLLAVASLVLVLVPGIGVARGGARRWLHLGPLALQPSEFAKFAVVLYLAASLTKKGERLRSFKLGVVPHCLVVAVIGGLVLLEPDFGTAAVAGGLLVLMLFVGGVPVRLIAAPVLAALPLVAYGVLREGYRLRRILAFVDPDRDPLGINFQLKQSFIAFGSGGLWGVGLGGSRQKMFYLPEAHTDFIFSVVGEELGLAGAVLVLGLLAVVAARGFRIALRRPLCLRRDALPRPPGARQRGSGPRLSADEGSGAALPLLRRFRDGRRARPSGRAHGARSRDGMTWVVRCARAPGGPCEASCPWW